MAMFHNFSRSKGRKVFYSPDIGIKQDFETLLQRYSEIGTVRYEKFAAIWREMKMSLFCSGRTSQMEAREFVEECFHIAVQYWLPPSSFQVRAGALYLLYGLFNYQLVLPKAKIRITQEHWKRILEFQDEAREQHHLDLDFVFQKMILEKAFLFVATSRELYPHQRDSEESNFIPDNLKEETFAVNEIFSNTALNQLSLVHDQYQKMKVALRNRNDSSTPDTSLNIAHGDWIATINKILKVFRDRQENFGLNRIEEEENIEAPAEESISKKKQLKNKAFEARTKDYSLHPPVKQELDEETQEPDDTEDDKVDNKGDNSDMHNKRGRGRRKMIDLYASDEMTQLDKTEMLKLPTLSMPELPNYDQLELKLNRLQKVRDPESVHFPDTSALKKGKGPLKSKNKAKVRKNTETETTDKSAADGAADTDNDNDEAANSDREPNVRNKNDDADETNNDNTDTRVSSKRRQSKANDDGENDIAKPKKVKSDLNKPKGKGVKDNDDDNDDGNDDGEESEKKHNAQNRLQQKLNQRKRQARQKKQGTKKKDD